MKGLTCMPWKELGESHFPPTWVESIKQKVAFYFTITILEVYLHSKFRAGSGQSPVFLSVCGSGCSHQPSSTRCRGMKSPGKNYDSVFLIYCMACGSWVKPGFQSPPVGPSPSGNSHSARPHLEAERRLQRNEVPWYTGKICSFHQHWYHS